MAINLSKNLGASVPQPPRGYRNSWFSAVLLVIVSVLLYWFIILPKKSQVDAANTQLTQAQNQETQMAGNLQKVRDLITQLQVNTQNIADLDEALPLDGNVFRLQMLINSLANSVGVTVGNISLTGKPGEVVAGNKDLLANPFGATRTLQTINGTVLVMGTFDQLTAFIEKLENSGRLIDISDISIDASTAGKLNLNATVSSYYLAP